MPVLFNVCGFFPAVMLLLFGLLLGPMSGPCGGIKDQTIQPMPSRCHILRCPQLSGRPQLSMPQSMV
jgi:hypothetical protein